MDIKGYGIASRDYEDREPPDNEGGFEAWYDNNRKVLEIQYLETHSFVWDYEAFMDWVRECYSEL